MTHPIDTSPEAIAALLDGVTPGPWRVEHETTMIWGHCDQDDVTDRGMGYPVAECRISPVSSWAHGPDADAGEANARFIAAARELVPALAAEIARLTAERDEARALLAILYGEEGMGNVTPADAAAALAARDAAMRNEGRRQAAGIVEDECTRVLSKQDGILPEVDRTLRMMCILLPDISGAILATLEPEGGE